MSLGASLTLDYWRHVKSFSHRLSTIPGRLAKAVAARDALPMKSVSVEPVGIKDVARAAGVSPATVSRAFGRGPISPELRAKVEAAARAIGYRPNLSARRLRSQDTRTIGLMVADIRNPFFTAVSRAVEDIAYAQGMRVILCNTDEDPDREAFYMQAMQEERVTGLIFAPTRITLQAMEQGFALDLPTVLVDRASPQCGHDAVMIDNRRAAALLVDHLASRGFTRIAGLFGAASTTGVERQAGYAAALKARGLPDLSRLISPSAAAAEAALPELWREARPDAVITSNSLLASGLLKALRARTLRVPDDIALATFDDEPWTSLVDPGLTALAQPVDQIGQEAMRLLADRIRNPRAETRIVLLPGRLVERGSSRRTSN
ncbi:LacI family DNA-binding transcriptional regulator [Brevundimonas sp. TSRC1-1]|uniref:LacI family DNA-binding transcriptional regulator n=1 Tax=Brevundimonas sp. TSRC1-1 TaxID=2804562 RepID=UPI003CEE479A